MPSSPRASVRNLTQRSLVRGEVRGIERLDAGVMRAVERRHGIGAAGVLGVDWRVEPYPEVIHLDRTELRIATCRSDRIALVVDGVRCERDRRGPAPRCNRECLVAEFANDPHVA